MELFSSAWQVAGALLVFLAGLLLACAVARPFRIKRKRALFLYLWHTGMCIVYVLYTLHSVSDAQGYYEAALRGNIEFSFGSAAVDYLTYLCVNGLGLSYLGTFLVYNIIGFAGLAALDGCLRVATADKHRTVRRFATLLVLLPSASFWSAAIGKDALSFLAVSLSLWAALQLRRRMPLMIAAIALMLLVRPHMAGVMVIALAGSQMIQSGISVKRRLAFGSLAIMAAAVMVPYALDYAGVGEHADATDVMEYIQQRQQENLDGSTSVDISSMSLPMQLLTYLLRPLPYEASSAFSLAASLENSLLGLLMLLGLWRLIARPLAPLPGNRAFLWIYSLLAWSVLASTTPNLGIALRQKWMFVPILIFLFISLARPRRRAAPILAGLRWQS
ncbi:hypothetical protein ERD78_18495 [Allopusillimonas soli]|uniref:Uncharacterized protein n=1 Tax=Allopusillimonas soli TaxID=659016 RepID=A0A853FDL9_9BURK|nr:hypothetical protein [Allopusillimonas soli]NYT38945.1 hypothetical protein [Allopusillimonas soli]TEA70061.1 hypothetical protein ERD78_18495 [Allopusillimonas soli]